MDAELIPKQLATAEPEALSGQNAIQYLIGFFFFVVGVVGVWLHGLNVKRLMKLDLILPEGFVSLHFHLALANLGIVAMVPFGGVSAFFHRWCFSAVGCQLYAFEGMLCGITSIALTCTICILQYADWQFDWKLRGGVYHLIAIGAWTHGFIWAILPILGVGSYALEPHQTNCALDMTRQDRLSIFYLCALTLVTYVIPVGAAIVSLCLLWFTLTADLQPTESDSSTDMSWTNWLRHTFGIPLKQPAKPMREKPQSTLNQRLKLCTKVNAGILLTSILAWFPLGALATCIILYGEPGLNPMLYYVPQLLAKWGCALTPVAYVSTLRRLQRQKTSNNLFMQLGAKKQ
ncbi:G0-opsin [Paragonimus westermani]|uniref:G0-opsin n=1 Tax=Paragonimus westermani TaxID=34504 RepID=A0A5J4NMJ7_9TREM|nr:G0-opsin [Paragonimus westermani]